MFGTRLHDCFSAKQTPTEKQRETQASTSRRRSKHSLEGRRRLTLEGGNVARDEELEAGAGRLQKVLDVSPGCQLVFLLHLFGAAGQVLGHTHLEVGLCPPIDTKC